MLLQWVTLGGKGNKVSEVDKIWCDVSSINVTRISQYSERALFEVDAQTHNKTKKYFFGNVRINFLSSKAIRNGLKYDKQAILSSG